MTFLRGFKSGMRYFSESISVIINTALLTVVYIVGVGLTATVAKLRGKKFLELQRSRSSYWSDLNIKKKEMEAYYRQF